MFVQPTMFRGMFAMIAVAALAAGGCSSDGRAKEGTKAVEGLTAMTERIEKGKMEVDKANASLDQMVAGKDMADAFKDYTASVSEIEKAGTKAKERRQEMEENRDAYIAKWQKELETMQNPDVKKALAARQEKVKANFTRIQQAMAAARDAYNPYLQNIKEIQKGLSLDLNPSGVKAMTPAITKAKAEGETLKAKLSALQAELTEIAGSMSPTPAK